LATDIDATGPEIGVTPQSSSSTYLLHNDFDKDTSNPDVMPLTVEEHENAMLLLETVITSIDATDSDLGSNEDADVDLLDILDDDLQRFDEDDPIHSSPEGFIDYFSRINIMRNQKAGRLSKNKFQERVDKWAPLAVMHPYALSIATVIGARAAIVQTVKVGQLKNTTASAKSPSQTQSNPVKPANIMYKKPIYEKGFRTVLPKRATNANTILNGDNAIIVITENSIRPHASGTTIKALTIVPSGTLRRLCL
jgi:hypothetical protein